MTMGEMIKSMLVRLEWFDTRFPRIPVNVQVSFMFIFCELKKKGTTIMDNYFPPNNMY